MHKKLMRASALILVLGIAIGAFGAHALKEMINNQDVFKTGSMYHLIHGIAIFSISLSRIELNTWVKWSVRLFIIGIILFSGSLYLLAMKESMTNEALISFLGPLTPMGGISFILGWILLILARFKD